MTPQAVLVGLPGTGKTVAGQALAALLGVDFTDTDEHVRARTGQSVQQIFAEQGEAAFRALEAEAVVDALAAFDGILALGGGAVVTVAVRAALSAAPAPVVLLRAEMGTLLGRVGTGTSRPLLAGSPAARLAELAHEREPLYRLMSDLAVDTDGRSPAQVAAAIADLLVTVGR